VNQNMLDLERLKWEGAVPLAPGKHKLDFAFLYDGKGADTLAFNSFFTGTLNKLTIKIDHPQLAAADSNSLEAAMGSKAVSE
jgi:arylsulfatase